MSCAFVLLRLYWRSRERARLCLVSCCIVLAFFDIDMVSAVYGLFYQLKCSWMVNNFTIVPGIIILILTDLSCAIFTCTLIIQKVNA